MLKKTSTRLDYLPVFLVVRFRDPRQTIRLKTIYREAYQTIGRFDPSKVLEIHITFMESYR